MRFFCNWAISHFFSIVRFTQQIVFRVGFSAFVPRVEVFGFHFPYFKMFFANRTNTFLPFGGFPFMFGCKRPNAQVFFFACQTYSLFNFKTTIFRSYISSIFLSPYCTRKLPKYHQFQGLYLVVGYPVRW